MAERSNPLCGKIQASLTIHLSRVHHLDGHILKQWLEQEKKSRSSELAMPKKFNNVQIFT